MRTRFADRLNRLFDTVYPLGKQRPYTSADVVAGVRERGTTMSAPYLSQLRSGNRDNPSHATMVALAEFFGIEPAYFTDDEYAASLDEELDALSRVREGRNQQDRAPGNRAAGIDPPSERPTETAPPTDPKFTRRLNRLLAMGRSVAAVRFTEDELAGALQAEGIALSARELGRLRSGIGAVPSTTILAAIAFQFDVSSAYFSDDGYALEVEREWSAAPMASAPANVPANVNKAPPVVPQLHIPTDSHTLHVDLATFGRIIVGLSEAASVCLDHTPPRTSRAGRLTRLLVEAGSLLGLAQETVVPVPRAFLEQALLAWSAGDFGADDGYSDYVRIAELLDATAGA
jgi:transcriptional regulator with XRE-family HTH domain